MDIVHAKVAGWECRYYDLPKEELDHRLAKVRMVMDRRQVEILMVINMVRGGLFQWLLGSGLSERPSEEILLIPRQGEMSICLTSQCFTDAEQEHYQKVDATNSQDTRFGPARNCPALYYQDILRHLGSTRRMGIVFPDDMRHTVLCYLKEQIAGLTMVDMTQDILALRTQKSPQELRCLRDAAAFHDCLGAAVPFLLRPYRLESDVVRELRYRAYQLGSGGEDVTRNVIVTLTSSPDAGPAVAEPILYPGRMLRSRDRVQVRFSAIAYNDYYGLLGRCYTLGPAEDQTRVRWQTVVSAQDAAASKLGPGATVNEAVDAMRRVLSAAGSNPDAAPAIFGLGLQVGEAPVAGTDWAAKPLTSGMVLGVAPRFFVPGEDPICCADMYEITCNGCVRLTRTDRQLVELREF